MFGVVSLVIFLILWIGSPVILSNLSTLDSQVLTVTLKFLSVLLRLDRGVGGTFVLTLLSNGDKWFGIHTSKRLEFTVLLFLVYYSLDF